MYLLYPSSPENPNEAFAEEFAAAKAAGLACSLFSCEDLELQRFKPKPALEEGACVLYRGWMLTPDAHGYLHAAIASQGAIPVTSHAECVRTLWIPLEVELYSPESEINIEERASE
ncbi:MULTISPECIES: hypothetical protein [unclassified Pseudomonas]|uniref:hypothetical protein n=1 Tax=unclassified Pseudomonas TaxID=196821 RepID=UPI0011B4A567|nr:MULTISPECIES: hypothetical protein [unclassified Pseudomonas]MDW3710608.1 hypothetical protein [Pseudomonas sp. 2023EL-01195]